ncbi:M24 family metallopeptidase [Halomarina rubra]|uniref:M24 family metallopeptidase n=1 Tax=Halomarina rubra TaxID=2071873 RepID=A0ABD6AQE3_9EURY|nr:aminopeptidase P family protein [Halomarina rubra]
MHRHDRLDAYLDANDLAAVWFGQPNNFTWLTGGSNVVSRANSVGIGAAGYDGDSVTVVTNNIEAQRLRDEEIDDDVTIETFDWHASSLSAAVAGVSPQPAAADFDVQGFESVDASPLRQPLTPNDIETYRSLGKDTAAAVESVVRELTPSTTEHEAATELRYVLEQQGCRVPVALVGGEDRAQAYRHFTPSTTPVDGYAIASVTAVRDGMAISMTRTVAFDPPSWLGERHAAAAQVEVSALAATQSNGRAGGAAGDVFEAIQDAYAAVGFEEEWRHHHQGGAAGFAGREWIASPHHVAPVTLPMGYAYNPTVQGAKSEGTALVTADTVEPLTPSQEWPIQSVTSVNDALTLERPAILYQ